MSFSPPSDGNRSLPKHTEAQKESVNAVLALNQAGYPAVLNHDFSVVHIHGGDMLEQDKYCREMNEKIKSADTKNNT